MGKGLRDAAHKIITDYVPGPNAYRVEKGSDENIAPAHKIGKGLRTEKKIPAYPGPDKYAAKEGFG